MADRARASSEPWSDLESSSSGARNARRVALGLLVAVLLAAGVSLLIGQAASYQRLLGALRRANLWWLLLSLAVTPVGYFGYALLYQVFTRVNGGPRPSLRLTLRLTVAVFGASVIATSAGRLGGEYWSLRRMREKPPNAWSRVLALNTAAWAALAGLAWIGAAALLIGGAGHLPMGVALAWLLVLPVCVLPASYLSSPARGSHAEDRGGRLRRLWASVLRSLILVRSVATRPGVRARGVTGGLLYWGAELVILWAALQAFAVQLDPAAVVVAYATGYASTILPLPAGGAGGVDAAFTYALTLVGVPLAPALLATLVHRLCSYWLPIAITIASARSIKRLGGDLAAVAEPIGGT